jgi:hypothetical protein
MSGIRIRETLGPTLGQVNARRDRQDTQHQVLLVGRSVAMSGNDQRSAAPPRGRGPGVASRHVLNSCFSLEGAGFRLHVLRRIKSSPTGDPWSAGDTKSGDSRSIDSKLRRESGRSELSPRPRSYTRRGQIPQPPGLPSWPRAVSCALLAPHLGLGSGDRCLRRGQSRR